jgi:thiamine pyrophosphokinase
MGKRAILILANGDWGDPQDDARLRRLVRDADHIVAADGALDRALERGISVHTLIGDLDSLADAATLDSRFPGIEVVRFPVDKDWTDLELAIDWALDRSATSITIFGAAGGRIDHTMANLALLEKGLHSGVPMVLVAGDESVRMTQGRLCIMNARIGDRVSLLPVSLFCTVSTRGLAYPLVREKLFRGQGRGISNAVQGVPVCVDVESGVLAVIHAAAACEDG